MIRFRCVGRDWIEVEESVDTRTGYVSKLRSSFGDRLSHRPARDLLRVGQAAFLADRAFRRGTPFGTRTRELRVVVPVENPKLWNRLATRVAQLAEFVSHDRWSFEFVKTESAPGRPRPVRSELINPSLNLFSDGLDSFCGATAAMKRGETPILVSHSPPGYRTVEQRAEGLVRGLSRRCQRPWVANFTFAVSDRDAVGRRNRFPERSRRTRPMLYLCMAGAIAIELGVPRIFLNENGVLAVNLPFEPDATGPAVSRHAHPESFRRFLAILRAIWPHDSEPTVTNPFWSMTKADELRILGKNAHLAQVTVSCEYARQQMARVKSWLRKQGRAVGSLRECGLCFPCLVRTSAMVVAGVEEDRGHYAFDARLTFRGCEPNADGPLYPLLAPNAQVFHDFCQWMSRIRPPEFVTTYLSQLSLLPDSAEGIEEAGRHTYLLYRRFARQFLEFLTAT